MLIEPHLKMATQATIAVIITELLAYYCHLDRSYWATVTAFSLISQTWGESFKRSIERTFVTIFAGIIATIIYFIIPHSSAIIFSLALSSVFLFVYFFEASFRIAIFFLTFFVVFLFATIDRWTVDILITRSYETLIGAVVAITVSSIVFPLHPDTNNNFEGFVQKIIFLLEKFQVTTAIEQKHNMMNQHLLSLRYNQLVRDQDTLRYELMFSSIPKYQFKKFVSLIGLLLHYTTSILNTKEQLAVVEDSILPLAKSQKTVLCNLTTVLPLLQGKKTKASFLSIDNIDTLLKQYPQSASLNTEYSYFYFLSRLNATIEKLLAILSRKT